MGLNLSTMNEQLLYLIFKYDFLIRTQIQLFSVIMLTVGFVNFTYYFFDHQETRLLKNIITSIMLLNLIFMFVNINKPTSLFSFRFMQIAIVIGIILNYGYIFYILLHAMHNKKEFLDYTLVITTSIFSYLLAVSLKILLDIDLGHITVFLIFIMMIGAALLMSHRSQLDYLELNALSEKLIMQDRLKDEFLARASHELRTPLHVMINLIKFLLEGKKGALNSQQQEDLLLIHQEGERMTRLVEDLLNASRIKHGEIKLRLQPFEPYKIVEEILREMEILISKDSNVKVINEIPEKFPALNADPDKFIQIIYNLLHNAIKYTKSGNIIVSAFLLEGQAEFRVTDTGIGIEEKYLKEVFDTFFQEDNEDYEHQGLGLGLSIVKHLVESHGGNIYVESTYKKGTSFIFTLPLYEGKIEEVGEICVQGSLTDLSTLRDYPFKVEKESEINIGRQTVLIVEDGLLNQRVLSDIVNDMGYSIILAKNGGEALAIIEDNKVDLIILDFMLPDMSGDLVCKEIRKKYSMVELPILVLTASGRIIDLLNAFEYGANDFQKKPADAEELRSRIQSLMLMKTTAEEGLKKEFQYFYSQISPHFLYNTLNTIIGLSYKDTEKARVALNNLSIYFRGKLELHRGKSLIPLKSELELVRAYLEIEQMRYGERIEVEYHIDEGLKAMIPPLTLQPLIENSIRHGLIVKDYGGSIKISVNRKDKGLVSIEIEDDGIGMSIEKQQKLLDGNSERVGFKNIVEKIKILKGASIELESREGEGTKITIIVPEVKSYESYLS